MMWKLWKEIETRTFHDACGDNSMYFPYDSSQRAFEAVSSLNHCRQFA